MAGLYYEQFELGQRFRQDIRRTVNETDNIPALRPDVRADGLMAERSLLFVPGDSEQKLARSADCPADAIVLDLEDSVAPSRKADARSIVRAALEARTPGRRYWVRTNAMDSGHALADLAAVVGGAPNVILLPKAPSPPSPRLGRSSSTDA